MASDKYKMCPVCGMQNRPSSLECRKCEADLTGVRVVDGSAVQSSRGLHETPSVVREAPAQLVRICSECGAVNPPQARKCGACGEDTSDIMPSAAKAYKEFAYTLEDVDNAYSCVIDQPACVIGRGATLGEHLSVKLYVSRQHAEITVADGKVMIRNLSGTNKTYVNDKPVPDDQTVVLSDGDEIGLGGKKIDGKRQAQAAYCIFRVKK